jgi:hypothetical protein
LPRTVARRMRDASRWKRLRAGRADAETGCDTARFCGCEVAMLDRPPSSWTRERRRCRPGNFELGCVRTVIASLAASLRCVTAAISTLRARWSPNYLPDARRHGADILLKRECATSSAPRRTGRGRRHCWQGRRWKPNSQRH